MCCLSHYVKKYKNSHTSLLTLSLSRFLVSISSGVFLGQDQMHLKTNW